MVSNPAILYVEDNPQSRTIMQMLLKSRMKLTNVTIFENSEDFIARVNALDPQPDVIFLDIHVEPIGGIEMLKLLRAQPQFQHTPIVALTASVMNEEVLELKQTGFNGCLAKPLDLDTFADTLNSILSGEEVWVIISR